MRFNIGDKVLIRPDLRDYAIRDQSVMSNMFIYCNLYTTITGIFMNSAYRVAIDNSVWVWAEETLISDGPRFRL